MHLAHGCSKGRSSTYYVSLDFLFRDDVEGLTHGANVSVATPLAPLPTLSETQQLPKPSYKSCGNQSSLQVSLQPLRAPDKRTYLSPIAVSKKTAVNKQERKQQRTDHILVLSIRVGHVSPVCIPSYRDSVNSMYHVSNMALSPLNRKFFAASEDPPKMDLSGCVSTSLLLALIVQKKDMWKKRHDEECWLIELSRDLSYHKHSHKASTSPMVVATSAVAAKSLKKFRPHHSYNRQRHGADLAMSSSNLLVRLPTVTSVHLARTSSEQFAVFAIAETDSCLKKFEELAQDCAATLPHSMTLFRTRLKRKNNRNKVYDFPMDEFECGDETSFPGLAKTNASKSQRESFEATLVSPSSVVSSRKNLRGMSTVSIPTLSAPRKDQPPTRRRTSTTAVATNRGPLVSPGSEAQSAAPPMQFQQRSEQPLRTSHNEPQRPKQKHGLAPHVFPGDLGFPSLEQTEKSTNRGGKSSYASSSPHSEATRDCNPFSRKESDSLLQFDPFEEMATTASSFGDRPNCVTDQNGADLHSAHTENGGCDGLAAMTRHEISKINDQTSVLAVDQHEPLVVATIHQSEDLICSYKQSKLSSCAVEGVVQIQVRSTQKRKEIPFILLLHDPCLHIKAIQENSKYAHDFSKNTVSPAQDSDEDPCPEYKFMVNLQNNNAGDFSPIVRYRCGSHLRPVPIRVQTRVRMYPSHCRVALQISSNPANEADLVDLTIIMGVPEEIRGETLSTSPPGGVWNVSKRSVIWCVAELGDGEKFQLQAQFEMTEGQNRSEEIDKPKFPVLVKCHCKNAHLSDVRVSAADSPEYPADLRMRLSHSFRLSHQERS